MNLKFKNTILVILSLFTTVATAQTQASAIEAKKKILFDSSNTPSTPYRIPAIATMSNGEIIAIADYRPGGNDVGNNVDVDIYARISNDNGANWSGNETPDNGGDNIIKIADGGVTKTDLNKASKGYGDAAVAADPNSGKIVVMSVGGGSTKYSSAKTSTSDYLCIRHYSEDYGRTWTIHSDETEHFKGSNNILGADVASMFFGSGKLTVSKKVQDRIYGALLVRQAKKSYGITTGYEEKNYVVYSEDWGATWQRLGSGAACTSNLNEPKVEELPNGDILISSRTTGGRTFNVYSMSNNKWGTQATYTFAEDAEACNGELLFYRGVYKEGKTYDIMLQSLPTGKSRSNVSIYYKAFATDKSSWSVDDFTSEWTKGIEVDNGASAYSTMTIMPNGEIGFLYEDDYDTSKAKGGYSNIKFVPLTVEEVTGGAYTTKAPVATPEDPTFTLSATSATMTVGETLKLTTTTNSDGTVSYSSSNTAVATVDATSGNVTAIAAGTATITASVPKTDKYNAASATCTITVKAATVDPDPEPEPDPTPEPTSITITATSGEIASYAYYAATFSHEKAMTVPSGVKAYYVKASGENAISLTQVPYGQAIPAGQGVLLISTNVSSMTLTEATENVASLTGNLLMPTLSQESVTFGANDYVLVKRNGEFVFAKASGSTVQNYKNHAYLRLNSNQANVRMIFDDNDATGINGIETDEQDAIYYDLMGRRVTNPSKGIYIKNGKKVLFR